MGCLLCTMVFIGHYQVTTNITGSCSRNTKSGTEMGRLKEAGCTGIGIREQGV